MRKINLKSLGMFKDVSDGYQDTAIIEFDATRKPDGGADYRIELEINEYMINSMIDALRGYLVKRIHYFHEREVRTRESANRHLTPIS